MEVADGPEAAGAGAWFGPLRWDVVLVFLEDHEAVLGEVDRGTGASGSRAGPRPEQRRCHERAGTALYYSPNFDSRYFCPACIATSPILCAAVNKNA